MMPDCPAPEVDLQLQVGLTAFGQSVGGIGLVQLDATRHALTLLAPTGTELFSVTGPPRTVTAGIAAWAPWLQRLSVERDLRLVFTPTDTGCDAGLGRIRHRATDTGWVRRWCGEGGSARAERDGDTVTLRSFGYTLLFVLPEGT